MDITLLPNDVFLLITYNLMPDDLVRCRAVSNRWHAVFAEQSFCFAAMVRLFPRCREMRMQAALGALRSVPSGTTVGDERELNSFELLLKIYHEERRRRASKEGSKGAVDWAETLATVARRYHNLHAARPVSEEHITLASATIASRTESARSRALRNPHFTFVPILNWYRYLSVDHRMADFHSRDPAWAYGAEDGLLVYAGATWKPESPDPLGSSTKSNFFGRLFKTADDEDDEDQDQDEEAEEIKKEILEETMEETKKELEKQYRLFHPYRLRDLETGHELVVPFCTSGKIIRRVRLSHGLLVFEWAEPSPFVVVGPHDGPHRHFATIFDIVRRRFRSSFVPEKKGTSGKGAVDAEGKPLWTWSMYFRREFELYQQGLYMGREDRYFTAHTDTHFAVYTYHSRRMPPGRPWRQQPMVEGLTVWDIRGRDYVTTLADGTAAVAGPPIVYVITQGGLFFYGAAQGSSWPQLREIALDEANVYFISEEHRWASGGHVLPHRPRAHAVRCVGIPIAPLYPASSPSGSTASADLAGPGTLGGAVSGPCWHDVCDPGSGDDYISCCTRTRPDRREFRGGLYEEPAPAPPLAPPDVDAVAEGPFVWGSGGKFDYSSGPAPTQALSSTNSSFLYAHPPFRYVAKNNSINSPPVPEEGRQQQQPTGLGAYAQPGRHHPSARPGSAPCWRHDEFPYLTVSTVVDAAAGVRFAGRACFDLLSLAVNARAAVPAVVARQPVVPRGATATATPTTSGHPFRYDDDDSDAEMLGDVESLDDVQPGQRMDEAELGARLYSRVMGRGHIAGDERWLVGETEMGHLTLLRF